MSTDLFYNPTGGDFSNKLPMKSVEKLAYLDSIEDLYRYNGKESIGVYYPVRTLPSVDIDLDAEWPVVMPAGCIVSVIPLSDARAYVTDHDGAGIRQDGYQYVSIGVDGTALEKSINYMYPKDVAGLIVPANGGSSVNDSYTANCGTYGILTMSGEVAAASSDPYVRAANVPIGIVNHKVFSDMRLRYLNYDARQGSNGNAIALGGVITIPYIGIFGAGARATVLSAVRTAVNAKHQYAWFSEADLPTLSGVIEVGDYVMSDEYGRFTKWDGVSEAQKFGKIIETRSRVPWNLDELIDSIPGSGMKGTDTGGLRARLYNFITSILSQSAVQSTSYAANKDNVKKVMYEVLATNTANVSVQMGQLDIAFGILK